VTTTQTAIDKVVVDTAKELSNLRSLVSQLEGKLKRANTKSKQDDELIMKLTNENQRLDALNKTLETRLSKLEAQLREKDEKMKVNREIAVLRQFAINVEYEIKELLVEKGLKERWGISRLSKTDLEEIGRNPQNMGWCYFSLTYFCMQRCDSKRAWYWMS
jgi:predicted  nucleic acid-binding Zn-ribbon protein